MRRLGCDVTVYERVAEPHAVGAGIVLQPTGLAALAALGLADAVTARAAPLQGLRANNAGGRCIVRLGYAEIAPGLCGFGLHRGALFEILLAATVTAGATVRLGVGVEGLRREGKKQVCLDGAGQVLGAHDLLIVADGARSTLRAHVGPARVRDYAWGALWFVGVDRRRAFCDELYQVVDGTHTLFGLLPTGLGPGAATDPLVSLFWSVRGDRADALRGAGFLAWKARAQKLDARAADILDQIESGEQLLPSTYKRVHMPRWHSDGIVALGDAAHAMSPQLGQGANLALYDAMVLAQTIDECGGDLSIALPRYSRERRAHVRFYERATYWLTPLFQSDHGWLGPLRDLVMGAMTRIRPFRLQMAHSMCGWKRGVVARSLPLPRPPPPALPALHP